MPSELQCVAQGLVDCLDEAPRIVAALQRRADICRQDAAVVMQLSSGRATVAAQQLDAAARACEAAAHYLSVAPPKARDWALRMVEGIRPGPAGDSTARRPDTPGGSMPSAQRPPEDSMPEPEADNPDKPAGADETSPEKGSPPTPRIGDEQARDLQRRLPVREETLGRRDKTRGTWVDDDGQEHDLVSGETDYFEQVKQFLADLNIGPQRGELMVASHVESKFAMFMRLHGRRHETIVVNQDPCRGKWGCEELIGRILPRGSSLTVFGPNNFKQTYPKPPPRGSEPA